MERLWHGHHGHDVDDWVRGGAEEVGDDIGGVPCHARGVSRVPHSRTMSPVRVRPVGGAAGCLVMLLVSVVLSVLLTVVLNVVLR